VARQINSLLVANRGEIAVRIFRTARAMGLRCVAVFSDADRAAPHVAAADAAVRIGPAAAAESYLSIPALIEAAQAAGADAIHPGYGFLAENADFAEACAAAGLTFIGPPVEAIRLMGDKRLAKIRMEEAGVPCIPGYAGADQSDDVLLAKAGDVGFPLMVKAAAGGGGRGIRRVEAAADLPAALVSARSEALAGFASDDLILEHAIERPRHIEIQIFADQAGHTVHLGERDCSVQRRHQKVIEEAPSPAVDEDLRARMGEAAVTAARSIGYVGAGTVEFLLDGDGDFYFMEMNTRLQVEHPVTEMITGLDLVDWQLRVAQGEDLPLTQSEIQFSGHAIEVRLYAEDPAAGFLPQTGRVLDWRPPSGVGLRTDHAVAIGLDITPHYDAMIAKVTAHGSSRDDARRRLLRGLEQSGLLGLTTNKRFLQNCLRHPVFAEGRATTAFIADLGDELHDAPGRDLARCLAAALLATRDSPDEGVWFSTGVMTWPLTIEYDAAPPIPVSVTLRGQRNFSVTLPGAEPLDIIVRQRAPRHVDFTVDGIDRRARCLVARSVVYLEIDGDAMAAAEVTPLRDGGRGAAADGRLLSPMPGRVIRIAAEVGQTVRAGEILVVVEAMKMEHEIAAAVAGTVAEIQVAVDDQVTSRQVLARIEPDAE
jgi:geranyl-CoA carboxylase alpha subunit